MKVIQHMKKIYTGVFSLLFAAGLSAQTIGSEVYPQLKDGLLDLNLKSPGQKIRIGGYVQTSGYYTEIKNDDADYGFDVEHACLNMEGSFFDGKLGFFLQGDFAESYPLLDAWVSYMPIKALKISAGQKQTFTNTRQMMMLDQGQAFGERSGMSQVFFNTGRELGLFLESRLTIGKVGAEIGLAVTSGDGRNSFGSSSTDPDCGGLKYGGRANIYPLGFFIQGNDMVFHDFVREKTPKLALGVAYSYNNGASNRIGEGHGDFVMYNKNGETDYPDYRRLSADLLFKWGGFSFLADYTNTTGNGLNKLYISPDENAKLQPQQITDYLALGNGLDVQAGYLLPNLLAVDLSYSMVRPEWKETENSTLHRADYFQAGVSKYIRNNSIKLQLTTAYARYKKGFEEPYKDLTVKFNAQIIF